MATTGQAAGQRPGEAGDGVRRSWKGSKRYREFVKYRFIAGFLAVPVALYAVFVISPFLQTIYYSLTDWTGPEPRLRQLVVGFLPNYTKMLDDDIFWEAL